MKYIKCKLEDGTKVKFKFKYSKDIYDFEEIFLLWKYDKLFSDTYCIVIANKFIGKFEETYDKLASMTDEEITSYALSQIQEKHDISKRFKRKL